MVGEGEIDAVDIFRPYFYDGFGVVIGFDFAVYIFSLVGYGNGMAARIPIRLASDAEQFLDADIG